MRQQCSRRISRDSGSLAATAQLDDATLVVRAQEGDSRAFEALVRRHQGAMYRLALRTLGDAGDAEEATQEAFLAAWRRLDAFRGEAAFSSWLYRIVTNRCLNRARARRSSVPLEQVSAELSSSEATGPERGAETNEQLAALRIALQDLSAEQRVCWVLREQDGLGYAQIAEMIGISPTAVRGRIYRARQQLSEVMRPWR